MVIEPQAIGRVFPWCVASVSPPSANTLLAVCEDGRCTGGGLLLLPCGSVILANQTELDEAAL